jgi:hypothetical protein
MDALRHRLPKLAGYVGREIVRRLPGGRPLGERRRHPETRGFSHVRNLAGGMLEWNARGFPAQH